MDENEITCAICDMPIAGNDLDDRSWLHEIGCGYEQNGGCDCDIEVHAGCFDRKILDENGWCVSEEDELEDIGGAFDCVVTGADYDSAISAAETLLAQIVWGKVCND